MESKSFDCNMIGMMSYKNTQICGPQGYLFVFKVAPPPCGISSTIVLSSKISFYLIVSQASLINMETETVKDSILKGLRFKV